MDIYRINTPEELLKDNTYPGRGIIIGRTPDGTTPSPSQSLVRFTPSMPTALWLPVLLLRASRSATLT